MPNHDDATSDKAPKRFQFGLRGLLIFVTVVCVLLGLSHVFGVKLLFFYPFATILLLLAVGVGLIAFLISVQIPVAWICSKLFGTNKDDQE